MEGLFAARINNVDPLLVG